MVSVLNSRSSSRCSSTCWGGCWQYTLLSLCLISHSSINGYQQPDKIVGEGGIMD